MIVRTVATTNFVLDSDFKWLLLTPAIVWLLGLVSYVAGSRAERPIMALRQTDVDASVE